ncbi:FAD-dependent oxidoreductase [Pseudopedobacter sp.]|uniref:FAD-dependent oxidoreductase n=1 Tax=Pseudopedobacter sp. TaxID=1936787 RepID=UPI003340A2C6
MKQHNQEKPVKANSPRDGEMNSPWQSLNSPNILTPNQEIIFDVLIIGGGITGITTALLLQMEGKKCIIIEARNLGFGTTGGTSAHLNSFFDSTYADIEKDFNEDTAKLVADSGKDTLKSIKNLIERFNIQCDYETKDGLLFSENEKESKQLSKILEASKKAGIDVQKANDNNLPIPYHEVIEFSQQGQFHPLKYLFGLAKAFVDFGGVIKENTFVTDTGFEDGLHYAESTHGKIQGLNIVHATHIPQRISLFNFKCAPYRSYVIAVTLSDGEYPDQLIYDMKEPYHYFRTHTIDGEKYLLIGGEDHKTGHGDPEESLKNLITYAKAYFNIDTIAYQWSSQYYVPADGLPYIGPFPGREKGCYVATGFNGNGMTFGTLSAQIISDAILGKKNVYAEIYDPSRIKPIAEFSELIKENADVAWHFVADRFPTDFISSLKEIDNDTGRIVIYNGHRIAVYKDHAGKFHALNPTCTHAGCIVNWNQIEKSWDCPCHGGRFNINGDVISGPPPKNLQKIDIEGKV